MEWIHQGTNSFTNPGPSLRLLAHPGQSQTPAREELLNIAAATAAAAVLWCLGDGLWGKKSVWSSAISIGSSENN